MSIQNLSKATMFFLVAVIALMATQGNALMPYTRSLWDMMVPAEDPFRILEHTPLTVSKGVETTLALARADWKETPQAHVISLDIPGMKKDDVKIEVEENRVVRVSGVRKDEEQVEGDKWHRAERINGKFWRQFRLPGNADLDHIKAHLEDGVLRIVVPKFAEEIKRQPKVIDIVEEEGSSAQDVKATKATQK
ncbi:22.7 kDa class IV heat shock protein-like [Herrania umbratica]|uniref:22.7 kDa class IV heat shock protein-like n=1 Tax=Herrania umbratica TaxID=108875 RepID=A0A6J1BGI6_9ROSI|nr:22.7 kDa class IV heat shock protein-like [Herrania umbratica]